MGNHRYGDGKGYYQPNKYKAQLNHQRAMRAKEAGDEVTVNKNQDDYFISSRRIDKAQFTPREEIVSSRSYEEDNFDVYEENNYKSRRSNSEVSSRSNRNHSPQRTRNQRYASSDSYGGSNNGGYNGNHGGGNNGGRKGGSNKAKIIVLVIAGLLILAMIVVTAIQIINSISSNNAETTAKETLSTTEAQGATQPTTEATTAPATNSAVADPNTFVTPNPEDNDLTGSFDNGFYIWNDTAFELFYGGADSAVPYAEAVNRYAKELGSNIKTYAMLIPTHVEMGLPERFTESGEVNTSSQSANIGGAYKALDSDVTAINCYNELAEHCNEYIYFNTDHHWTGLGSYYGYSAFAKATNQEVLSLDDCTKQSIEGFYGTLAKSVSADLPSDTVEYWEFPYETSNDIYYESDGEPTELTVYYGAAEGGSLTYGVFIWGDQPLEVLHSDRNTGKKIAIVKESFGNALVPYFTYNYDEVHVVDFRYWEGNLKSYCEKNGITEVLFANGVMSANTESQIEAMDTLFN